MKIGIMADTHGYYEYGRKALEILDDCDRILHLGDVLAPGPRNGIHEGYDPIKLAELFNKKDNIIFIKGNCDADVDEEVMGVKFLSNERLVFEADGKKILATHGYKETVDDRIEEARALGIDVVLVGHTHIKRDEIIKGIRYICPGSAALPKDESRSVAIYEAGAVRFIEVKPDGDYQL